jgi:hypothetical protein
MSTERGTTRMSTVKTEALFSFGTSNRLHGVISHVRQYTSRYVRITELWDVAQCILADICLRISLIDIPEDYNPIVQSCDNIRSFNTFRISRPL